MTHRQAASLCAVAVLALATAAPAWAIMPEHDDSAESAGTAAPAQPSAGSMAEARELIDEGRYAEAVPILESLAAANPTDPDTLTVLGFAYRKAGNLDASLESYLRALYYDGDHVEAHEYLGELYLQKGDPASAQQELATLERLCPSGCEAREDLEAAIASAR